MRAPQGKMRPGNRMLRTGGGRDAPRLVLFFALREGAFRSTSRRLFCVSLERR